MGRGYLTEILFHDIILLNLEINKKGFPFATN